MKITIMYLKVKTRWFKVSCELGVIYTEEPVHHSYVNILVGVEITHGNKPNSYNT